jgi:MFS family permease
MIVPPRTIAEFLGLKRNVVILLMAVVILAIGEELWLRFLPKYLEALGAAVWVIGLYDAIKTSLGALYAYPGGVITDRWGHRKALVLFTLISICGYSLILLVPHWAGVLVASFFFLAWSSLSLPATFTLIGASLVSNKHAMGIGVQSTVKRISVILGPILGGVLIDRYGLMRGVKTGVVLAILLAAVAVVFQLQIREPLRQERKGGPLSFFKAAREFDPALRRLLLSDILVRFCERIPYAWVVIYCMNYLGTNATQFGVLTGIEMATAVAFSIPVAHLSDKYGREPFILATFVFFTLFPIFLLFAQDYSGLILSFVIRGLKEFGEPARKSSIIGLSPEPTRARTIGAYYLIRDSIVTSGSFLGALLWEMSPRANFLGAALAGVIGTVCYVRSLKSSREF